MAWKVLIATAALVVVAAGLAFAPLPLAPTRVVHEAYIEQSPEAVYAFVTTPRHWPTWHPASRGVTGAVDHSLDRGEEVVEDFLVAGRAGRAVWTVVDRDSPRYWRIEGRIGARHAGDVAYSVSAEGTGTKFVREFVYPSRNLLFVLVNTISLRAKIEAESVSAVANLKHVLETRSLSPPA